MRKLETNWEAEVASVRGENRGLRSSLEGAQAQQRQAEERARALEQRVKEALISNIAWHRCFAVPVLFQTGPEATFSRRYPFEG
jgi:hypothetical protein